MQIEFLGSGGAIATPAPGMMDQLNVKARTLGRRIFELNRNWGHWPDTPFCTQVAADAREHQGLYETLAFHQSKGLVKMHELRDGDVFSLNGVSVQPFRLAQDYAYGLLLRWLRN